MYSSRIAGHVLILLRRNIAIPPAEFRSVPELEEMIRKINILCSDIIMVIVSGLVIQHNLRFLNSYSA